MNRSVYGHLKVHRGEVYSGMRVGRSHAWDYRDARWDEVKDAPDRWRFTFTASKHRRETAPLDSGATVGSQYHWYVLAHQFVRKVDANTYTTWMAGAKWKLGHRRPDWLQWSHEYANQEPARSRVERICYAEAQRPEPVPRPPQVRL